MTNSLHSEPKMKFIAAKLSELRQFQISSEKRGPRTGAAGFRGWGPTTELRNRYITNNLTCQTLTCSYVTSQRYGKRNELSRAPELPKEAHRAIEVFDGEIDEDFFCHVHPSEVFRTVVLY